MENNSEDPEDTDAHQDQELDKELDINYKLSWFGTRVASTFKLKSEKVDKFIHSDDFWRCVSRFLESAKSFFVLENSTGDLETHMDLLSIPRKKGLVFYRQSEGPIPAKMLCVRVCCAEIGPIMINGMLSIIKQIYFPLLKNKSSQQGWSVAITKEVYDKTMKFISNSYVQIGHMTGKTLLPLPPEEAYASIDKSSHNKESIYTLEGAIVMWTDQIRNILALNSETIFLAGGNPGPEVEIDFWSARAADLNSVHDQLCGPEITKIAKVLEITRSTYFPSFSRLCQEVQKCRVEANDINSHLRILKPYLNKLRSEDFSFLISLFKPICHLILLIWAHSKHFNTTARIVILVREICNDLIKRAQEHIHAQSLFEIDVIEAVSCLKDCIRTCVTFKSIFCDYKSTTITRCPSNPWRFQDTTLFSRVDNFLERCHDILDLMQTILQFSKLERVEIGGTKGKILTSNVQQISADFNQAVLPFKMFSYDIASVEAKQFDEDFYNFRLVVQDLERRIGSVISHALDDSTTVMGCFKLLDSFENLLERDVIVTEMEDKHTQLLKSYAIDLKMVQDIFMSGQVRPNVNVNCPPRAGAVIWVRGLMQRLEEPMQRIRAMGSLINSTEEGREILQAHTAVMSSMQHFEETNVDEWAKDLEQTSQDKLKQSLLRRDDVEGAEALFLRVNFDPALVCLLREVKYFKLLNDCKADSQKMIQVPESAMQIFSKGETYRQQTGNLELIVNIYNSMCSSLLEVERPLIQAKLDGIDKVLLKGLKHMNWKSSAIGDFITQTMFITKEANHILQTCKANVKEIQATLGSFASNLMMERKANKSYMVDEYKENFDSHLRARYHAISKGGHEMHKQLESSLKVLKVNKAAPVWRSYLEYVNQIVIDGLVAAVLASIRYLKDQIDPAYLNQRDVNPLLEIGLRLAPPDVIFEPVMGSTRSGDGMHDMFFGWLNSFINSTTLLSRLDTQDCDGDYLNDVQENLHIRHATAQVTRLFSSTEQQCEEFRKSFLKYSYLWTADIQQKFQEFLEQEADNTSGMHCPPLSAFDAHIFKYKHLQLEIQDLPSSKTVGFLKIDAKPIKHALSSVLSKWTHQFQDYLLQKVISEVTDLSDFINFTDKALETEVSDQESMLQVMGYLRDVRKRTESTDKMFEPLRHIVSLLAKHNVATPPEIVSGLEQLPLTWTNVKKKAMLTKDKHSKEQSVQAEKLKRESKDFEFRVEEFFNFFKRGIPSEYSTNFDKSYELIDRIHHENHRDDPLPFGTLMELKKDAARLNELQELFELYVIDYRQIDMCMREIKLLKSVWDMIALAVTLFAEWRKTKWDDIDVDVLSDSTKQLAKEIKACDKQVRNWAAYKGLEDAVKNMQTALPLVQELHHPAMRDRHWKQLMRATGVSFVMGSSFSLGNLLDLKLHDYEDDVLEIVDRAQKELTIERQLQKLSDTWKSTELGFPSEPENPDCPFLQIDESLIEALEDNSMQLQNMIGTKYVQGNAHFLEQVQAWQRKLGMVDVTLNTWREVQSKWSNLQNIFVGSADIRVQLPEESKRFELVDFDWKEMMKDAPNITNAVDACNLEGRLERIETMLANLEACEKALNDYLETKRAAYPRFYFVAAADLLDILSKGANPQLILRHLPKCFENVKSLEFEKDVHGAPTRTAVGMYSGENEYVEWKAHFVCEGAVETWLDGLTTHTHLQLKWLLVDAVAAFEEKPRHSFVFDWCAELCGVVCRIMHTEDVNLCFEQLEEGNESALREYNSKQVAILNKYSELILGDLDGNDRRKIIMLVTLDVHARDVVQALVECKAENNQTFGWVSQLKFQMDDKVSQCRIDICDYMCYFGYEYVGNCGCLVVTPLTDRCYITLTQAMRLILGGAPAGPAGTGKTETTKDLGRALGIKVYVFNCSDQMDYRSMGQVFKGLSQAGAWGCFDEFNRIDISVLSVVSTQWKCVLDAIRSKKQRFMFEDEDIMLCHNPLCSAYITMNPGYAGRTELPESVKALFRPCAMITPDMDLICEIMLMSEGYSNGKILSRKFMILYRLSEDLLSSQKHYDWKLRAVKTTLNVAGGMLRADRQNTEENVLLRALRDFNLGKLVEDDVPIFMGMLDDLFPKIREQVSRVREPAFENAIVEAAHAVNLQAEDPFILKCSQLREILAVRWSVFLIGPAGCGKSELIKVLSKAENLLGEKSTINALNPKSVTRNELYGFINSATREWKDGLLSQIFRDLANTFSVKHEYLVLDGDIDAEWIESMNTVMDDNKTLTLASNERIPLTPPMRLLFEIENMGQASPATVSRGGVVFMNSDDVGWRPFMSSWIQNREIEHERTQLSSLFGKYITRVFDFMAKNLRTVVPIPEISRIQHLTYILEGLIGNGEEFFQKSKHIGGDQAGYLLEITFVYAVIWSCGGALTYDRRADHRAAFDKWFRSEFADCFKSHDDGTVFDFWVDQDLVRLTHWSHKAHPYMHQAGSLFGNIFVPTVETERLNFLIDLLMKNKRACMVVGPAGTGKTTLVKDRLRSMDSDVYSSMNINLNCFTDSMLLQGAMESALEKKTGRTFGPPGSKKLIYFIDDLNMPEVDKYGTQQPIALLRQLFDYAGWYSRDKLVWREVHNVQVVSCLNPTAGSFHIDKRLQRSYCTYSFPMPSAEHLEFIFSSILSGHLSTFNPEVMKASTKIVKATVDLHKHIADQFMPTAIKFHYVFNLRDISNIFEGVLRSVPQNFMNSLPMIRLWMHECDRVYSDRLVTEADLSKYVEIKESISKRWFESENQERLFAKPNIFITFGQQDSDESHRPYCAMTDALKLTKIVQDKLSDYNECNAVMNLVLFDMAVEHICRITRIIEKPRGSALLVGVGGSGKQSLAMLSSFICNCEIFQITVTSTYGINDFKEFLLLMYRKAGGKGIASSFIMTDGQIIHERFLVFLNDFLASGNIPDIFTNELKDEFRNAVRNEVKMAGIQDTPDNLWDFFIEKVRKNLHIILCFSPVGDKFRIRARQFPAIVNCTTFDFFHPWPQEALIAVAQKFIFGTDGINPESYDSVAQLMALFHSAVNEASEDFLHTERRYNHTTPKSFLDLIDLYKSMLASKKQSMQLLKKRLENGLDKMQSAAEQVAELQENLVKDLALVQEKKEATDSLLTFVGQETAIADEQKAIAVAEEEKCAKIAEEVSAFQAECEREMAAAEPVVQAAIEALNSLDKKSLTELKALASPPVGVDDVTAGVMVLLGAGKIPKDVSWGAAKKLMGNLDQFLNTLLTYDKNNAPVVACDWVEKNLLTKESFNPVSMKAKSSAAAGMCAWVVNIVKYYRIYEVVEPKRQLLSQTNARLAEAKAQLTTVRAHVANLEAKLAELRSQFESATAEKNNAIAQAEKTQSRANMATRLVNGLADEKVRWSKSVELIDMQEAQLVGDMLLASAFVSYVGAFTMSIRNLLVFDKWLPAVVEKSIPLTEGMHPLNMLADDATIAQWSNEGLPTDSMSVQNGAVLCSCKRWPLLIDPQLQGVKWLKRRHAQQVVATKPDDVPEEEWVPPPPTIKEMTVVQMTQKKYLTSVEQAISNGDAILIENLGESLDAILQPVLMKAVIKRGRAFFLKLGDKEVEYDSNFKLFLQTKMSNPHYKPEIAAQTTLINFMITPDGLQEQLLALVVNKERPDLEEQKRMLMEQQNGFKVKLKEVEDELLYRLATSQGDILSDVDLIEGLERAKVTSNDLTARATIARETEKQIVESRKAYIPVAVRGALMYFLIDQMYALDHMYQFSMASFIHFFKKGMDLTDDGEDRRVSPDDPDGRLLEARIEKIVDSSCFSCFTYVAQGLFERHKLVFASQLCFRILAQRGELPPDFFDFLLRGPTEAGIDNPLSEWMDERSWGTLQSLKQFEAFERLPDDIIGSAKRFREWYELERPEDAPLPGDWKKVSDFQKLMIHRTLRADRTAESLTIFVRQTLGARYVLSEPFNLRASFQDASPSTPIFFILSPGVDPVKDTERFAKDFKVGFDHGNFSLVSLGQGQETVAEKAVESGYRHGGWVFLQNIHLTPKWTSRWLERRCEHLVGSHPDFRLFLSAEPAQLPVNLLQVCIKLTNEPPQGMKPNLLKCMYPFNDEYYESSSKPAEFKSICFALSLFHAIILERKKFGPQGWNRSYPFNAGDLVSCAQVALNYLEINTKVPWDDLRYIFGEIMYGGHITDHYDRILALTYLESYMNDDLLDGFQIFPGFQAPQNSLTAKEIVEHIEMNMPQESPIAFGLHSNAEIGFRMKQAEQMFADIRELQPSSGGAGIGMSQQDRARSMLDEIVDKLPESFEMQEILERIEEKNPFVNVFLQEIERCVELLDYITSALAELDLGLKGDLQMSERMEVLQAALADDRVPATWEAIAYPSKRPLGSWFLDLLQRHKQLVEWTTEVNVPKVTWFSALFNPQSFLTAITQTTARKNDWPLDKTTTLTEVTRKFPEDITSVSKEGAYISGLQMEGARWDDKLGQIEDSRHKELFAKLPVILVKGVTVDKSVQKDTYSCPVYRTQDRGPTFIFVAALKTKASPAKWVMAGVALLMDVA